MKYLASAFYGIVNANSPTVAAIVKRLQHNKVDEYELFYMVVENFFYGYLPFSVLLGLFSLS